MKIIGLIYAMRARMFGAERSGVSGGLNWIPSNVVSCLPCIVALIVFMVGGGTLR